MSTTNLTTDGDDPQNDDQINHLQPKKEQVIQPISDPSSVIPDDVPGANEDLLKELRAKTAKLAESVSGPSNNEEKVLEVADDDPELLIKELKKSNEPTTVPASTKPEVSGINRMNIVDPAIELIRGKLSKIFKKEPDAEIEAIESFQAGSNRSVHQQYMYDLTTSGKSLAEIQTKWHEYYVGLPEHEKHEVWAEFYSNQRQTSQYSKNQAKTAKKSKSPAVSRIVSKAKNSKKLIPDVRAPAEIKNQIMNKVSANGKLNAVHHAKSLFFGLSLAVVVGLILTFTFFNEVFLAPFISPSQTVSATPILGADAGPIGPESKIIIPKINLEVPVVFGLGSIEEKDVQNALEDGVVHYASTPKPGEKGNSVIVGHSSNNILNSGKYKFAFVLLKRLEPEDTFFVHKGGVRYTYKVYKKQIVPPTEVSVLQTQERANTMTLITCDPPGTSLNRLIVTAEQISPDPSRNKASTSPDLKQTEIDSTLPSNAPSLWSRIWPF